MFSYDTASQAIKGLIKRGYITDFNLDVVNGHIKGENPVSGEGISLSPKEFEIDEIYRFEGNSDPGDEMVVYAISSHKHHIKGVLVNAFGPYSDSAASAIVKKLSVAEGK